MHTHRCPECGASRLQIADWLERARIIDVRLQEVLAEVQHFRAAISDELTRRVQETARR